MLKLNRLPSLKLFMCVMYQYNALPNVYISKHIIPNNMKIEKYTPGKDDCCICASRDFQPH